MPGSQCTATLVKTPSRTVPASALRISATHSESSCSFWTMACILGSSSRPASVSSMPPRLRCISRKPYSSSRSFRIWLIRDWVEPRDWAALVRLPSSTVRTNASYFFRLMGVTSFICGNFMLYCQY